MKRQSTFCAVALLAFAAGIAAADDAGTRVIEEELVVQDPTMAAARHWAVGGSFEGWGVVGPYNTHDQNGKLLATGNISGGMVGGNGFIGYDNWTLQYSHRGGTFDVTQDFIVPFSYVNTVTQKQAEDEVTLRYLVKSGPHFNPYIIVGYNGTSLDQTSVLSAGAVWTYNGKATMVDKTEYSSTLIGVGAIIPFNKSVGLRGDGRLLFTSGKYTRDDGFQQTGSGVGGAATGTIYVNIAQGLNVQAGFKSQVLNAGPNFSSFFRTGFFGSLGYSYKF
jgi:hypothetical protein